MTPEPLVPLQSACKVCGHAARLSDVCDFGKSCQDGRDLEPQLVGVPVYWYRCGNCGLFFSTHCDAWSRHDFASAIYNADYTRFDPDHVCTRPLANAQVVMELLGPFGGAIRLLDYGGGDGQTASLLVEAGMDATSLDPYLGTANVSLPPKHSFDVVCAFEVLEHSARPLQTLHQMRDYLRGDGLLILSTLLQPPDMAAQGARWWYCGPRNGHITLFSAAALELALAHIGAQWLPQNDNLHLAVIGHPAWLTEQPV